MDYALYYRQSPNDIILDKRSTDVNGDNIVDDVYLVGNKKRPEEIVISNIRVMINDGQTGKNNIIDMKVNKGYNPRLFLGNFTLSKVNDVMVSIESGNTGLEGYYYIYSFINNVERKLFDFEDFNAKYMYDVQYLNNYTVIVTSRFNNKQYTINISNKNKDYLSQIYNPNGTLNQPLKGMVSPIIELHPVVSESEIGYDLYATQRVIGYYNADTLGMMVTPLRWNGKEFVIIDNNPYLTLFGTNINK